MQVRHSRVHIAFALLGALVLAACGSGDGSSGDRTDARRFQAPDVAFTFEYPPSMRQSDRDSGDERARISPEPGDLDNALKVSQVSGREETLSRYVERSRQQLSRRVGGVDLEIERHRDIEMGLLSYGNPTKVDGRRTRLESQAYYFVGGGRTWRLECLSTSEREPQIRAACRQALDTIRFEG